MEKSPVFSTCGSAAGLALFAGKAPFSTALPLCRAICPKCALPLDRLFCPLICFDHCAERFDYCTSFFKTDSVSFLIFVFFIQSYFGFSSSFPFSYKLE